MYLLFARMSGESYYHKDLSRLRYLSPGTRVNTRYISLCTLYLHTCQVRVTVGDSGLCCCICDTYCLRFTLGDLCTLHLHVCQVRVTVGDSGLCHCTC